jgi:hypothetical protein
MQGAAHPAKVTIQRQPFEEVRRRTGKGFDEIIEKRGWIAQPPRDLLHFEKKKSPWTNKDEDYMEDDDFDRMRDANLLRFMLGHTSPIDVGDAVERKYFKSFPSDLDSTGVNGNTPPLAMVDHPDTPIPPSCLRCRTHRVFHQVPKHYEAGTPVFRDLPDYGRRSPRSRLFCSMIQSEFHQDVRKLETSEVCQSYEPAHSPPRFPCPFVDDETLSDAQEAETLSKMLKLIGDDYHDVRTGQPKASYGQMCDMLRDQGAARALRELYQVEETDLVDSYAEKICWDPGNPSLLEQLRTTIAHHFAAGESSNSVNLHAAISNIEDKYLAEEEEDEAASDLSCSQQRLALEIERFVGQSHS